jgi:hypothetical protein
MPDQQTRYLTPKEFLQALQAATGRHWSRSSLYRAIARCKLPASRVGGTLLIDREAAERDIGIPIPWPIPPQQET